jgi:hypothetical protein
VHLHLPVFVQAYLRRQSYAFEFFERPQPPHAVALCGAFAHGTTPVCAMVSPRHRLPDSGAFFSGVEANRAFASQSWDMRVCGLPGRTCALSSSVSIPAIFAGLALTGFLVKLRVRGFLNRVNLLFFLCSFYIKYKV